MAQRVSTTWHLRGPCPRPLQCSEVVEKDGTELTWLAWNKLGFVVASCNSSGAINVWDAKHKRRVMTLRDAARCGGQGIPT